MPTIEEKDADFREQIRELIDPVIRSEGMELIELEYRRESPGWVLRLFIDQEGGVTVDDCAKISQVVGDFLDVADLIQNPYHLEVSSPGLDRPLRKPEHFRNYIGKVIDARTVTPIDNRRRFKGILLAADDERITVEIDGKPYEVPLSLIERARLCYFESFEE